MVCLYVQKLYLSFSGLLPLFIIKAGGPKADTCSSVPTSSRILNPELVQEYWQIQIEAVTIFLKLFKAHLSISFIIKVKILFLVDDLIGQAFYV
jgi:hypothetical protein